ncbi:unnamed protein product [Spirodela intermedia]|uniref:Uncharacterized protein n=1 Tax=Spirodela intermedia TaxID=51605 RepID=A0A7I8IHW8_SPIIN|nr:unnamed protein product [Spirodela intermedia]CAA6657384.1 unnamed protein product [Spirodela intermedia]
MNLWVAVTVAVAGYLAEHCRNALKNGWGGSSNWSCAEKADGKRSESGSPHFRRLTRNPVDGGVPYDTDGRRTEALWTGSLLAERTTNHGPDEDKPMGSEEYVRSDVSLLSLHPGGEEIMETEAMDQYPYLSRSHISSRDLSSCYGSRMDKNSPRSRRIRKYSLRPLNSSESSLIPQLYKDKINFEEHVFPPFPSLSLHTRKSLAADCNQRISRSDYESFQGHSVCGPSQRADSRLKELAIGIPQPWNGKHEVLDASGSQQHPKIILLPVLFSRVLFFFLGLSISTTATVLSYKREVDRLNASLKQSEDLVQDLQEELEMRNSLIVRELVDETCEERGHQNNFPDSEDRVHLSGTHSSKFCYHGHQKEGSDPSTVSKVDEAKKSMSVIEAELEAELERLELDMRGSGLDGDPSDLADLDPCLVGNLIEGELREGILRREPLAHDDSLGRTSGSSTVHHTPNYSVSPRELSLRLHGIIQSQLEERIKELEMALYYSEGPTHLREEAKQEIGCHLRPDSANSSPVDSFTEAYEDLQPTAHWSGQTDEDAHYPSHQALNKSSIFESNSLWKQRSDPFPTEHCGSDEINDGDISDDDEGIPSSCQIVEKTRRGCCRCPMAAIFLDRRLIFV